jgi:GTP diphosphokinase / guanosine-3',5'-bis(diphosphate) 3'-diphosphatase
MGAKVNGKMVPLDTKLENRDVVEILTKRDPGPNRDWLAFVVTSHAKNRIRSWFRAASREGNVASGRAALEEELQQTWNIKRFEDLPKRAVADALDGLHLRSVEELYAQLGDGSLGVNTVIRRLIPDAAKPANTPVVKRTVSTGRVLVEGEDLHYTLAPCCNPVFPQPLIGFVTRGRGITVHTVGCPNVPTDAERYASCRWETDADSAERLVIHVEVRAVNRIGLVSDIASTVAAQKLNLAGISSRLPVEGANGETIVNFGLEVPDMFVLAGVIRKLERLPGVLEVHRLL